MTDYQSLTNKEIDKLAAEMMGFKYSEEPPVSSTIQRGKLKAGKEFASYSWPINPNGSHAERFLCNSMLAKEWNPTHKDSNQAERYLFPKLIERETYINIIYGVDNYGLVMVTKTKQRIESVSDGLDQINRTKVIACLEAMEKINE